MHRSIQPITSSGSRPLVDYAAVAAVVFALIAASGSAAAVPGDLDASFGTNGVVTTPLPGHLRAGALVQQSTGKLVLAGGLWPSSAGDVVLVRYTTGGSVDPSFGGNGSVTTDLGGSERAWTAVVQPDDKIVVLAARWGNNSGIALLRYLADGALDPGFGLGGVAATPIDGIQGLPAAVALQPDGKLLVAGTRGPSGVDLVRLTTAGVLDQSFGVGGKVTTPIGGPGGDTTERSWYALAVQADGRIVVKANTGIGVELARYLESGTLDTSFGSGGHAKVMRPFSATGLVLQPDGKLVMGGLWACGMVCDVGLVRLTADGALDPSFGVGGVVNTDLGAQEHPYALILQPNGRIVVAGGKTTGISGTADFLVLRYLASGALDAGFGVNGAVVTDTGGYDLAWALLLQADGRLVALGESGPDGPTPPTRFVLARYAEVIPPEAQVTAGPSDGSATGAAATFAFTGSDNLDSPPQLAFACSLDDAAFSACTSPIAYSGLGEGPHRFAVRATDRSGNVDETPATRGWTVDTSAPDTQVAGGPTDGSVTGGTATFAVTGSDNLDGPGQLAFQCSLDDAAFAACTSPIAYAGLVEGAHHFSVQAIDRAGNVDATPATRSWTVDATPPETTLASSPPELTRERTASFSFSGTDALTAAGELGFECALDGAAPVACSSPYTLNGVGDGHHSFSVSAVDRAGNHDASAASHEWTVDATAPSRPRVRGPHRTSKRRPSFRFSASDALTPRGKLQFLCAVDSPKLRRCSSVYRPTLRAGRHLLRVAAVDNAGNRSALTRFSVVVKKQ